MTSQCPARPGQESPPLRVLHVVPGSQPYGAQQHVYLLATHGTPGTQVSVACAPGGWLVRRLSDARVAVHPQSLPALSLPGVRGRLAALIRAQGVQLVHTHLAKGARWGNLAARDAAVPSVSTVHNFMESPRWFRPAARLIAVSGAVRDNLVQSGFPPGQVVVVHNGVDTHEFELDRSAAKRQVAEELGIPPDVALVGTVGKLRTWKGQHVLLAAAPLVLRTHPQVHFLLVGGGDARYKRRLRAFAREQSLQAQVHLLGDREDVPRCTCAMDVAVVPSLSEPFGMVVVEAMAAGTPVVASSVGGIVEIVEPEETGLLVRLDDPWALAEAVSRLLSEPGFAQALADRARKVAAARFSAERMAQETEAVYRQVLGSA